MDAFERGTKPRNTRKLSTHALEESIRNEYFVNESKNGEFMTLSVVQKEIERWTQEDQDRLAASLSVLRLKRDPAHAKELARRLDDTTPGSWLTLDELKRKLMGN